MIKTHRLSDAQAAVLSGPVEYNASGSIAVTSGRENTLASLRKLGLLAGNLLTVHGNDARVTVQSGERKISAPENGRSDTFFLSARECTDGHPVADGVEINAVGMCMPCVREGQAKRRAEYEANLIKWQAEADAKRAEEDATMRAQSERMETVLADVLAGYSEVTDADLDALAARGSDFAPGPIREAEILRPLTPRVRALVRAEGMVWMNTTPGWDWSGSLWEARRNVLARKTTGRELNARLMAYDPDGTKAAEAAANGRGWDGFMADAHTVAPVVQTTPADADADTFDMANLTDAQTAVLETNLGRVPEVIKATWEISASNLVRSIEHHTTYYRPGTLALRADVDPAAYSSAVINANDTAREEGWTRLSAVWFDCLDSTYAMHRDENESTRQREAFEAQQQAEADAAYAAMLNATHVIQFEGTERAMCGERVDRRTLGEGILRVSVDPSDATCPECLTQEAALATRDDAPEPSDDECHQAALLEALEAAESHMEAAPVLTVTKGTRGRVCARVGAHAKEFNDGPALRLHVSMWAHTQGFRPAAGRKFRWSREGDVVSAPAALI